MILHTNENNPAALKILISAKLGSKNLQIKIVEVGDRLLPAPKHLPYIEIAPDNIIFIPNSAVWFLNSTSGESEAVVNEWLEWESIVLTPNLVNLVVGGGKNEKIKNMVLAAVKKLDTSLQKTEFLVGDKISNADVAVWCTLYPLLMEPSLGKDFLPKFVITWLKKIEQFPEVQEALKEYNIHFNQAYQAFQAGAKYFLSNDPTTTLVESPQHQPETLSADELESAEKAWKGELFTTKVKPILKEILPRVDKKNILITAALPYVNNVPHLGNIIGCVLSGDVFARFCRICDYNTLYVGGTDEYGTATETKAIEEGLTCQEICDKYHEIHRDIYEWFNIGFNHFGRTSTNEQTVICQRIFHELNDNGFIFTEPVEQLHCENCDRYLADRFVEGGCPHLGCNYEDARGDQCDSCGKLVNAIELKNPRCKMCSTTPKVKTSSQFFIDLPKVEPLLYHWMKKATVGWSNNAQMITRTWMREGLKPRCITRDLKWGVSVPLKGFETKVFYVWYDAPIGYMSITHGYTKRWQEWWQPKKEVDVQLYQFMAKDNVPFHSVMFPACLLGANKGYTLVSNIMATEYLNYEDGKFSKSRGIGVFGNDARNTGIPSDVWRFYLLYVRPETQDSSFSWADLATKTNSELLNNLGNFINRALVFAKNNFNGTVPEMNVTDDDLVLLAHCTRELKSYVACLEKAKLRDGIRHILSISRHGNQYVQANQPWVLLKGDVEEKKRARTVVGICCNLACLLATLLYPYMPATSATLSQQLNTEPFILTPEKIEIRCLLPVGHKMGEPSPLFTKLDLVHVEELKKKFGGGQVKTVNGEVAPNVPNDVKSLEEAVAKQANKVRELKANGLDKKSLQPEVAILLDLKKKLENASKTVETTNGGDLKAVEDAIAVQGTVVRKLKGSGAEKSVWQPEVEKLLELKKHLSKIGGGTTEPVGGDKKNKKKK